MRTRELVAKGALYILYEMMLGLAIYDLSSHSNFVSWGDSRRDGLDMLSVVFWFIPAMAVLSVVKVFFWKGFHFVRFSSLAYTLLFFLFFLILAVTFTQTGLLVTMLIGVVIAVANMVEFLIMFRTSGRASQ